MKDALAPSVFPRRWFPFEGPQEQIERVVETEMVLCGHYDPKVIPDCQAKYFDEVSGRRITFSFFKGSVWKTEAPVPPEYDVVAVGDDARVYRSRAAIPRHVRVLAYSIERKARRR